jgi:hypothetical protein
VIRSFSQNSLDLNSALKKVELLKKSKVDDSNDTLSRESDPDKFQIFDNDDPTVGSIFDGKLTLKLQKPN